MSDRCITGSGQSHAECWLILIWLAKDGDCPMTKKFVAKGKGKRAGKVKQKTWSTRTATETGLPGLLQTLSNENVYFTVHARPSGDFLLVCCKTEWIEKTEAQS